MGLMNVGKGEGAQIIQLFGRGVRLKGYDLSLKRSGKTQLPESVKRPKHIGILETLGIFGIHADYMAQFRDFLEEEGLPTNDDCIEFLLPVIKNLGTQKLKTIRLKKTINGVSTEFGDAFRKLAPVPTVAPPSPTRNSSTKYLQKNPVVLNWYPKIQAMKSGGLVGGGADNDTSRVVERLESQHRAQSPFHPAVVLLYNVVQVLTATNLHRVPPPEVELTVHSHAPQGAMARPVAIQSDAVWLPMMLQRLAKEGLRRCDATCPTEKELHSVALSVHGSIQVHPLAPHLDKRFINPLTPTHRPLESAPALFTSFGIANDPTQNRGVRNR